MTAEKWVPIEGFERYEVSDLGRVRRQYKTRGPRVLRPRRHPSGYVIVDVYSDAAVKVTKRVHKLVMGAFVGPRPEGLHTRHLDGDPTNNALSNLRYGTNRENQLDRIRHGRNHLANRTECGSGHPYPPGAVARPGKGRYCSPCNTIYMRRYRHKRAAA